MRIGILGGTGKLGRGLALRWAGQGANILLGSREPAKAARIADEINHTLGRNVVQGLANREAAADAEPDSPDIVLREVRDAIHKHGEQVAKLAAAVQSAVDLLKLIHSLGVVEPNTGEVAKDG